MAAETINEIRARVRRQLSLCGIVDEFEEGRTTAYKAVLRILDDVEKENPVSKDIQEAAEKYDEWASEIGEKNRGGAYEEELNIPTPTYADAFEKGAEVQLDLLMKEAVEAEVYWNRGNEPRAIVHFPKGFAMPGEKVSVIIKRPGMTGILLKSGVVDGRGVSYDPKALKEAVDAFRKANGVVGVGDIADGRDYSVEARILVKERNEDGSVQSCDIQSIDIVPSSRGERSL